MATLVVLSFEDDEESVNFVRAIQDQYQEGEDAPTTVTYPQDTNVVAIYKRPTLFHGAFESHGGSKTQVAWTMGQKWGWWICSHCKKPSELYWESIVKKQSSFGRNLLDSMELLMPKKEPKEDL